VNGDNRYERSSEAMVLETGMDVRYVMDASSVKR
jgi:hypothetical protein